MRLVAKTLMLTGLFLTAAAAGETRVTASATYSGIVQSLTTREYQPARVVLSEDRATIEFNNGRKLVLMLESAQDDEEEILARDQRNQYWAIYVYRNEKDSRPLLTAARRPIQRIPQ